ncbi:MAG: hypothetical protein V7642_562 [Burkholderiales bacterium]
MPSGGCTASHAASPCCRLKKVTPGRPARGMQSASAREPSSPCASARQLAQISPTFSPCPGSSNVCQWAVAAASGSHAFLGSGAWNERVTRKASACSCLACGWQGAISNTLASVARQPSIQSCWYSTAADRMLDSTPPLSREMAVRTTFQAWSSKLACMSDSASARCSGMLAASAVRPSKHACAASMQ